MKNKPRPPNAYESLKGTQNQPKTFQRENSLPPINTRNSRYTSSPKNSAKRPFSVPKKPDNLLLHIILTGESEKSSTINQGMTYFNIKKTNKDLRKESMDDSANR